MFIAGVVVGGIIAGVVAHGDHSNYRDYREYSDAQLQMDIKTKEMQVAQKEQELNALTQVLRRNYEEDMENLKSEKYLSDFVQKIEGYVDYEDTDEINDLKAQIHDYMRDRLEVELIDDKKQLSNIDAALARINEIQLTKK